MRPSPADEVRKMYEDTADSYAQMMEAEIDLPIYADVLGRLRDRIENTPGTIVDTAMQYHRQIGKLIAQRLLGPALRRKVV